MNTKKTILNTARDLFNNEGTENVTTRRIAEVMGISHGNLHYHYPNRNEVILALQREFLTVIDEGSNRVMALNFDIPLLLNTILSEFQAIYDYRFLYIDQFVIWRRIPKTKEVYVEAVNERKKLFPQFIKYMVENDMLKPINDREISGLLHRIIIMDNGWLFNIPFFEDERNGQDPALFFLEVITGAFTPYLHDTYKEEIKNFFKHRNS
jgi:AcrR family transcriptional regulator